MDFKKNTVSMFKQGITKTYRHLHVTGSTIYRWVKQDDSIPVEQTEKYCWVTAQQGKDDLPQVTKRSDKLVPLYSCVVIST
jgi:catalase